MTAPTQLGDDQLRELLLQVYLDVQRAEQERGTVPREGPGLRAGVRRFFEYATAIVLGLFIASACLLAVFVVTRVLLHVDFSRYTWL